MDHRPALAGLLLLAAASPATAIELPLPIVAATCAPSLASGGAKLDNRGSLHHSGTTTGTVTANCAFDPGLVSGHSRHEIALTYRDSTGMGHGAAARASVIQVDLTTRVRTTIATVSSDDLPFTGTVTGRKPFFFEFNYAFNLYYIELSVSRGSGSQKVEAYLTGIN